MGKCGKNYLNLKKWKKCWNMGGTWGAYFHILHLVFIQPFRQLVRQSGDIFSDGIKNHFVVHPAISVGDAFFHPVSIFEFVERDVLELDFHGGAGVHLEADEAAFGVAFGAGEMAHLHAVDVSFDHGAAADDAVVVPVVFLVALEQLGGGAEWLDVAFAVGAEGDVFATAGDEAVFVVIDEADEFAVAAHVGLVAVGVPVGAGFGAYLDAGIAFLAELEFGGELEVFGLAASPDEVVAILAGFFRGALRCEGAVFDVPPAGRAVPAGEVFAVEECAGFGEGAGGGERNHR